ncbi:MAG TPA: hypothetical protein DCS97_05605, partial [Planctomycetes bacterium]|nr:hypothetical protein [Planctomycetota bacterium]
MSGFHLLTLLMLLSLGLAAAEPTVARNGWSNLPGVVEGTVTIRPADTTQPKPPLGFLEYLPKGYDPADTSTTWPLLVFCAGIGEIGDGTDTVANDHQLYNKMTKHGPLYQVVAKKWDFPAIVIGPQQPGYWNNATVLKPVLEYLKANYRVDASRIYLSGLCDGAGGLINFAAQNPGYLAGILPVETSSAPAVGAAANIRYLPMWMVHCYNDPSIARTSSVAWFDQAAQADLGASNVMATYPGYAGKPYHVAADSDPATGLPLKPFGPVVAVEGCTLTNGSTWIGFGTTTFGSAMFNTWGGTDAAPYARVAVGAEQPGVLSAQVVALGKPNGLFLTKPYSGPTAVAPIRIQIPIGFNATAYYDPAAAAWNWQRDQLWDTARPGKRIFTMFWYQNHVTGWVETYANGSCWDWLFTQQRPVAATISVQPQSLSVLSGMPASFSVTVSGTAPLSYQWLRGGTAIVGATAATYTIASTNASDDGLSFSVRISNAAGATTSSIAILTITPLSGSISVADLGDHQVVQRSIGGISGTIRVSGTYSGAPHQLQARVLPHGGGVPVVDWTTIINAPSGGDYSATLVVPQGGWYQLEVRSCDTLGNPLFHASGSAKWGVGLNLLCIGQSNMLGFGDNAVTVADDRVGLLYGGTAWRHMADPWISGGKASCGPAVGNALVATLGIPVGLIPSAAGTTYMVGTSWNTLSVRTAANHSDPATVYGQALGAALKAGGVEFVLVAQGANEAVAGTVSSAGYVAAFDLMRSHFAEDLPNGSAVVFALSQLGRRINTGDYDAGYNAIREAHRQLDDGVGTLLAGSTLDLAIVDSTSHYGGAGQAVHGRRFASSLLHSLGLRPDYGGPRITEARFRDSLSTAIRVNLAQHGGTDLTPATAIPGFVVSDANGARAVHGTRIDSNTIDLSDGTPFAGAATLTYLAGKNPAGPAGLLADNQPVPEPVLPVTMPLTVLPVIPEFDPATEPMLTINGWSNNPGMTEGTLRVRAIDTTQPKPPYGYLEYLPRGYDPANATMLWPLLVFLPSVTEAGDGTDNAANGHQLYSQLVKYGPLFQVTTRAWDFPSIIIAPQVVTNWTKALNVKNVVEYAKANYRVDEARIYMTGNREGANGTLRYAAAYPGDLAAILTIETSIAANAVQALQLNDLPMWAAHSFADPSFARTCTIGWIDAIAAATYGGSSDVMATYPGYGDRYHFAVDRDPTTGQPANREGFITTITAATIVPGGKLITFPAGTAFGSTVFGMWSGSDNLPFARVRVAGDATIYTAARGYSTSLSLTAAYAGTATSAIVTIQTPVG